MIVAKFAQKTLEAWNQIINLQAKEVIVLAVSENLAELAAEFRETAQ